MPFIEGKWVNLDPHQEYKDKVIKAKTNPESYGRLWNDDERKLMHDNAARFLIEKAGLPVTPANLETFRAKIAQELEEDYNYGEKSGILKQNVGTDVKGYSFMNTKVYKHLGD